MAIKIFGSIGFGTAIGYFLFRNMDTAYVLFNGIGQIVIIGLCVLLFFVGTTVGIKGGIWEYIKKGGSNLIIFPMAGIIGTLLGTGICSIFIGMNPTEGMAVCAGFGWYTIAPVLMESHSAELSALSFIHNLLRVFLSIFLIPQVAKRIGYIETTVMPGVPAADLCLPIIEKATNGGIAVYALITGMLMSVAVPFLTPLLLSL